MNDDPTELERELRGLKPLRPSGSLEDRLAELLDVAGESVPPLPWYRRLGFISPLAACAWSLATPIALILAWLAVTAFSPAMHGLLNSSGDVAAMLQGTPGRAETAHPITAPARFEPAVASNVPYQTRDEGVVLNDQHAPVHRVRVRSQDTLAWRNPQTGAQWEVSYPREDVLQLPLHTE